ncbi:MULTISPECIES: helix-turn-helix transcriptional regulator [unclassified Streptomyces]|uniref:helix-turn-helix domain-containing protein n=1 Tax=unclassified Streptomyces TaxID=2593676 RepID=UPI0033B726B0
MIDGAEDELSPRAMLAAELTRQRERAGWTLAELADRSKYDPSYLQRLEKGVRLGSLDAIDALDRLYGTGDLLSKLWRAAKREAGQSRFQGFVDLEAEATSIQEFAVSTVPGLLQTPGYAEALLRTRGPKSEELLTQQVTARIARQDRLIDAKPLNYRGLLDESVLRRPPRDAGVWTEQLERLVSAAEQPNIVLQVVPFSVGLHNLLTSPLQLLWLPSGRTVAYVESSWTGHLVEETEEVDHLRLSYDRLRDSALSPTESLDILRSALEDH